MKGVFELKRLNYFSPYENQPPWHEDQLTRSFLVLLKYVPLAQVAFLDLVKEASDRLCQEIEFNSFSFFEGELLMENQTKKIKPNAKRVFSVVITDENWKRDDEVKESERSAVYDAVVYLPNEMVFVIENKPSSRNIWEEQLNISKESLPKVEEDEKIEIMEKTLVILWKDFITRLTNFQKRDLLSGTEARIVDDYLYFIEENFPFLNPYERFSMCKDDRTLLKKKCHSIIEKIAPDKVIQRKGGEKVIQLEEGPVKLVSLKPTIKDEEEGDWGIYLRLWPGDTVSQARKFFYNVKKEEFFGLKEKGWKIWPNMHFAFMRSNLVWSNVKLSVEDYFNYWKENSSKIKRETVEGTHPQRFNELWDNFLEEGIISENDLLELEKHFGKTQRPNVNICPGFFVEFTWAKEEAEKLDNKKLFIREVREKIKEALSTWDQTMEEEVDEK